MRHLVRVSDHRLHLCGGVRIERPRVLISLVEWWLVRRNRRVCGVIMYRRRLHSDISTISAVTVPQNRLISRRTPSRGWRQLSPGRHRHIPGGRRRLVFVPATDRVSIANTTFRHILLPQWTIVVQVKLECLLFLHSFLPAFFQSNEHRLRVLRVKLVHFWRLDDLVNGHTNDQRRVRRWARDGLWMRRR